MADKTRMEVEVEIVVKGLEKLQKGITDQFSELSKTTKGISTGTTFSVFNKEINRLETGLKEINSLFKELHNRALSLNTATKNPFSQIFSKADIKAFKDSIATLRILTDVMGSPKQSANAQWGEKFGTFITKEVDTLAASRRAKTSADEWLRLNKNLADPALITSVKKFRTEMMLLSHGLDGNKLSIRNFSLSMEVLKRDFSDLLMWQARWYGTKAVLFTPLEKLQEGTKAFVEWQQGMKNVQAVSQTSSDDMKKLEDVTMDIGRTTPISAKEAAKAMLEFAQAGVDVNTIQQALPVSAKMVIATQEDMSTAVSALTTIYNVWKGEATNMSAVGDKLAASMAESKLKVADLGTIFNYLASTSKMAGISLNDTLVLVTALSQAGVKASTIGTGLSTLISNLTRMPQKFSTQLASKGLKPEDVMLPENNILTVLKRMKEANVDIVNLFTGIEMRGGRSAAALLEQVDAFDKIATKINEVGILNKMFGTSMEGIENQTKRMGNILTNVFIEIGRSSSDSISKMIGVLTDLVSIFEMVFSNSNSLRKSLYELDGTLKGLVLIFTIIKDSFGMFFDSLILGTEVSVKGLISAFKILGTVIAGVVASMEAIFRLDFSGAFDIMKQALKDANQIGIEFTESIGPASEKVMKKMGERGENLAKKIGYLYGGGRPEDIVEGYIPPPSAEGAIPPPKRTPGKPERNVESNLFTALRRFREQEIAIIKAYYSSELATNEEFYKNDLMGFQDYSSKKLDLNKKMIQLELEEADKYLEEITNINSEVYKEYQRKLGESKTPEQREATRLDYESKLMEARKKRVEIFLKGDTLEKKSSQDTYAYMRQQAEGFYKYLEESNNKEIKFTSETMQWASDEEAKIMRDKLTRFHIQDAEYYDFSNKKITEDADRKRQVELDSFKEFENTYEVRASFVEDNTDKLVDLYLDYYEKLADSERNITKITQEEISKRNDLIIEFQTKAGFQFQKNGVAGVFGLEIENLNTQFGNMGQNLLQAMDGVAQGMYDTFKTSFFDMMTGELKTFEDYIDSFAKSVANVFADLASKFMMLGISSGLSGFGFGDMFNGLFGGAKAAGGPVQLNKSYLVGERGPELFTPNTSGRISPNGIGGNVNVAINLENQSSGPPIDAKVGNIKFDGHQYIVGVILKDLNSYGPLYHAMKGGGR